MNSTVKFAYAAPAGGISTYILDNGTWDGTPEDAQRFPQVDLSGENDSVANATEEFRKRGLLPTMITDLRLVANGDQWGAVAELDDDREIPVWAVNGNEGTPPWLTDEKEYERWYNLALEEAHKQGYFLEGELG